MIKIYQIIIDKINKLSLKQNKLISCFVINFRYSNKKRLEFANEIMNDILDSAEHPMKVLLICMIPFHFL